MLLASWPREGLPIREAASSRALPHTAANTIGKQVVVIADSSAQRGQRDSVIRPRARGVAARVPENVVRRRRACRLLRC